MSQSEEFSKAPSSHNAEEGVLLGEQTILKETEETEIFPPSKLLEEEDEGEQDLAQQNPGQQEETHRQNLNFLAMSYFFSGFAALAYEIIWQRILVRIIGASTPAVSIVICAFMLGLAVGGGLGNLLAKRRANLIAMLAGVELLIGLSAGLSIYACQTNLIEKWTTFLRATAADITEYNIFSFISVFLLVAMPTALMGATLPIVAGILQKAGSKASQKLASFYAINSTGAVFGAFVSGFYLLPLLGISQSTMAIVAVNLLAAGLALCAFRKVKLSSLAPPAQIKTDNSEFASRIFYPLLVFCTGAISFTMEIVWTRYLIFLFGSSTYALSLVLSVFIAGLSTGAWIASVLSGRARDTAKLLPAIFALTALAFAINLHQYQAAPALFLAVKRQLMISMAATGFTYDAAVMFLLAVFLMFVPAVLVGTVLPLLLARATTGSPKGTASLSTDAAVLYCASVLGSVAGSFGGGVLLLPVVAQHFTSGIEITTVIAACFYVIAALLLLISQTGNKKKKHSARRFSLACVVLIAVSEAIILFRPPWNAALISSGLAYVSAFDIKAVSEQEIIDFLSLKKQSPGGEPQKLLMYKEGLNSTVSVISNPDANLVYLKTNGKTEAAVPIASFYPAPQSDLTTHRLLGFLPGYYLKGEKLEGLAIGLGSGTTCGAICEVFHVDRLKVVELEDAVLTAGQYFHSTSAAINDAAVTPSTGTPEQRKKITTVIADARNHLFLNDDKYDFIVSQPAEPWLSGASDLYTQEFYRLARSRLKDRAVFCQWLPMYSLTPKQLECLVRTFQSVFTDTRVWHPDGAGEIILVGQIGEPSHEEKNSWKNNFDSFLHDLQRMGIDDEATMKTIVMQLPADFFEVRNGEADDDTLNTDDNLLVEGRLARDMNTGIQDIDKTFDTVFGARQFRESALQTQKSNPDAYFEAVMSLESRKASANQLASDWYLLGAIKGTSQPQSTNFPQNFPASLQTGLYGCRYYLHMGNIPKALELFKTIDHEQAKSWNQADDIALIDMLQGDYKIAQKAFVGILGPRGRTRNMGAGLSAWLTGDQANAREWLTDSLLTDPNQFLARYALAHILMQQGRSEEALTNMRAASKVFPESPWPGIFVSAYYSDVDLLKAKENLALVLKRKAVPEEAYAIGYLLSCKWKEEVDKVKFQKLYKDATTRNITVEEARAIAKKILNESYILPPIKSD